MASGTSDHHFWRQAFEEQPLMGDFEKYGPRGNGMFAFQVRGYIPLTYMKGEMLESYEIGADKLTWHVRKGVYWHGNKPNVMQSRELVADDFVWWVNYRRQAPAGTYIKEAITDAKKIDKYTLEIPFAKGYDFMVMYLIGYEDRTSVEPPESVKAGPDQWENYVGTGPFMNDEYVVGSYFKFTKNPNYWDTTTIDGKQYKIPFADEMIYPIIPEEASRIASLRTGKIDWHALVPAAQWDVLDRNPDMISSKVVGAVGQTVALQVNKKPFNDLNVRHALMIGTDMNAFNNILGASDIDMPTDWWPAYPGDPSVYTPKDQLPGIGPQLYKYDPAKAKKMLADAGYPNGFKMEVIVQNTPQAQDRGALLASQWAKLGVQVDVNVCDNTTYVGYRYNKNFKDALITVVETPGAVFVLQRTAYTGATLNPGNYSNPVLDAQIDQIVATRDIDLMNKLTKAACVDLLMDTPAIPVQVGLDGYYWWPWLQNYYGEFNVADANQPVPLLARMWIDQDMKTQMGF
jgi:peptide/nickel transport system substrate-binding protein